MLWRGKTNMCAHPSKQAYHFSPKPNKAHLIHWNPWEEKVFSRAQGEDRPIFLSISAVWCHWCHVFDETTLSDPGVIELLNRDFLCIRVDADRNPHIQSRYLAGGWPTSAFLTPTGDVILSGTYVHPEDFKELALKVKEYYKARKGDLYARIARFKVEKRLDMERQKASRRELTQEIPLKVIASIKGTYDPTHGGFGDEPKFPQPDALELLFVEYQISGGEDLVEIATNTLDSMMHSELWDTVEKGFFRYSTKADWSSPHYEKMLEANAGLLKDYLLAYQTTGKDTYRKVAEDIMAYVDSRLYSPDGGFYGSQDADEEYYKQDVQGRIKFSPPPVDKSLYANWNGLTISQYLHAYRILRNESYLDRALRALDILMKKAYQPKKGMYHYVIDEEIGLAGLLVDQVYMAEALVVAYETTTQKRYLELAIDVMDYVVQYLGDKTRGGFFDIPEETSLIGNLSLREKPLHENSLAARVLNRLYHLTGKEAYHNEAERALKAFLEVYPEYSFQAASYALAVMELIYPPIKVVVVGPKGDPRTIVIHKEALDIPKYWKVVQVIDPRTDTLKIGDVEYPSLENPVAYICKDGVCSPPFEDPVEIKRFIREK